MRLGEICLLTNNVVRMSDFYKQLLGADNNCKDEVHQTIIAEETMLTIMNDGLHKEPTQQNMCIAFTVEDIESEYNRIKIMGAQILEPPTTRPWGTVNMSFEDPDGNVVYLRSFPKG